MASRPSNNPYNDNALLVDRLIGTAYDVVRIVSENIRYVQHVSINLPHVITANDNIEIIRTVSTNIDKVIDVADNLPGLNVLLDNMDELNTLYAELAKLLVVYGSIADVVKVADNLDDIQALLSNMDKIDDIILNLPDLLQVIAQKDEILAAAVKAGEYADASNQFAGESANAAVLSKQYRDNAQGFAQNANTSATNAAGSAQTANQSAQSAIAAKNSAEEIRNNLLTGITASATSVPSSQPAKATYNPSTKNLAFDVPVGAAGPAGPANSLSVGTVSSGSSASATITGNSPDQKLNLVLPKGADSWTPVIAAQNDGERRVQRVVDWAGGSGTKPAVGMFLGSGGFVATAAEATNVRGAAGMGSGDMLAANYDPTGKDADAFNMENMVEGATKKILSTTERTKLAGIAEGADKTPTLAAVASSGSYADLSNKPNIPQGTVTSVGITAPAGMSASEDITGAGKIALSYQNGYLLFTTALQSKLDGIAAGATANATDAQLRDRSTHTGTQAMSTIAGLAQAIADAVAPTEKTANKNQANGYAGLDVNGKVATAQLPEAVLGAVKYQGGWNASTNSPAIPAASSANLGWYRIVTTAGTTAIDGVSDWQVGDWIVSNGTKWDKVDSSDQVNSVNGKQGTVVLVKADVGLANADNTSDLNKPISTATQTALNGKANTSHTQAISTITGLQDALDTKASNDSVTAKADKTVAVSVGGLATGGGTLGANFAVNVPKATTAQAQAGTLDTVALTPLTGKALADAAIAASSPALFTTEAAATIGTATQNNSGKPLFITASRRARGSSSAGLIVSAEIVAGPTSGSMSVKASNSVSMTPANAEFACMNVSYIVPPGWWYQINLTQGAGHGSVDTWSSAVN